MSQYTDCVKALFLSEEEAMALLDLCLMSRADDDPLRVRALRKLADLVRRYIEEEQNLLRVEPELYLAN